VKRWSWFECLIMHWPLDQEQYADYVTNFKNLKLSPEPLEAINARCKEHWAARSEFSSQSSDAGEQK
jgi:hypothetical protein